MDVGIFYYHGADADFFYIPFYGSTSDEDYAKINVYPKERGDDEDHEGTLKNQYGEFGNLKAVSLNRNMNYLAVGYEEADTEDSQVDIYKPIPMGYSATWGPSETFTLQNYNDIITDIEYSDDGTYLAISTDGGNVEIYDVAAPTITDTVKVYKDSSTLVLSIVPIQNKSNLAVETPPRVNIIKNHRYTLAEMVPVGDANDSGVHIYMDVGNDTKKAWAIA